MIQKTSEIILEAKKHDDIIVVVSAMSKVTNQLNELCDSAQK